MKYILILLLLLSGCSTVYEYNPGSRVGVMYHYSGHTKYACSLCKKESNLFRLDRKDRVVCQECYQKSNRKYLYH